MCRKLFKRCLASYNKNIWLDSYVPLCCSNSFIYSDNNNNLIRTTVSYSRTDCFSRNDTLNPGGVMENGVIKHFLKFNTNGKKDKF